MTSKEILKFIKEHSLAVIATVNQENKPEAAVVEFGEFADLTIIIDTLKSSRKYKNLLKNENVAIVIGWDENITVQIEGTAKELSGKEFERAKQIYFIKNPRAKKWADNPDIVYYAIKPTWIRYSDLNQHPWLIEEFEI